MTDVPHLGYPFQLDGHKHAVELEQDSIEEVTNCVEVICRTDFGALDDLPTMGITDPTFRRSASLNQLSREIAEWEPRASIHLTQRVDSVDELINIIKLEISTRG